MTFSARHYRSVSPPSDTPEDIADRRRRYAAAEQARRDREARYPVITADNADAVLKFQERRYQELYAIGGQP